VLDKVAGIRDECAIDRLPVVEVLDTEQRRDEKRGNQRDDKAWKDVGDGAPRTGKCARNPRDSEVNPFRPKKLRDGLIFHWSDLSDL
jgi:hypothetical protein